MIQEAVILAGGLGTRLREAVPDLPKCMAQVAGRPFISYVIDALRMQGINRFIFSLGYKADILVHYIKEHYPTLNYEVVIESEPLGTGGAILLALQQVTGEQVLIANGDTLFRIRLNELYRFHQSRNSECTLALKLMHQFDRYGVVDVNEAGRIVSFKEKQFYTEGFINGGIYLLNKKAFLSREFPAKFSFEKDYLERFYETGVFHGMPQMGYFIDIGIPEDYLRAQEDFKKPLLDLKQIDKSWTLFLDRDGVINEERIGEYVLHWEQFVFSKGVLEAFKLLTQKFGRIIVVSNQRGVGKALMSEGDLLAIHKEMQKEVESVGGRIDAIYYCTDVHDAHPSRKPNPGMAYAALQDFPDIDLQKSIMVGNKPSDMRFGRAAGMFTVFLATTNPDHPYPHGDIDDRYPALLDFARAIQS